ncbi:hypothetical protein BH18ACI2_BH18ACI2_30180 [soil metagenome]
MKNEYLTTCLNDHLAGSVGALEMLDDMIDNCDGKPLDPILTQLRADIRADQDQLKALMKRLDVAEGTMRKAGAWMMEKLSRAKLSIGDSGHPNLELLQSLEMLLLGITGKRSLWRALSATGENTSALHGFDLARLETRASDQIERVEAAILEIARAILRPEIDTSDE